MATETSEKRCEKRQRVIRSASIVFDRGNCLLDCRIVDLSTTGARLDTSNSGLCPARFELDLREDRRRLCEVIWRRGTQLGVRFLER